MLVFGFNCFQTCFYYKLSPFSQALNAKTLIFTQFAGCFTFGSLFGLLPFNFTQILPFLQEPIIKQCPFIFARIGFVVFILFTCRIVWKEWADVKKGNYMLEWVLQFIENQFKFGDCHKTNFIEGKPKTNHLNIRWSIDQYLPCPRFWTKNNWVLKTSPLSYQTDATLQNISHPFQFYHTQFWKTCWNWQKSCLSSNSKGKAVLKQDLIFAHFSDYYFRNILYFLSIIIKCRHTNNGWATKTMSTIWKP